MQKFVGAEDSCVHHISMMDVWTWAVTLRNSVLQHVL